MKIGNLIYEVRESRNMTRAKAAEGICSDKYIYLIENGDRVPSVSILYQLSRKLKFNFFHTLSYMSDDNPLALKAAINKFMRCRNGNDLIRMEKHIEDLQNSDDFHKESFKQLTCLHRAFLDLKYNKIDLSTFERLEDAFALTNDLPFNMFEEKHSYSYLELMCLVVHAICRYLYYGEFNLKSLNKLYEYSKSLIQKDEATDVALLIIRYIIHLLKHFNREDEIEKYLTDFHECFIAAMDYSSETIDTNFVKELISLNIDIISRRIDFIFNKNKQNILQLHFIGDRLLLFKTVGVYSDTFTDGLQQAYEILEREIGTHLEYDMIIDLSSFSQKSLPADYFSLNMQNRHIFNENIEKLRKNTYMVVPKLNQTILDVVLAANQLMTSFCRFEPIIVSSILDGILLNEKKDNK